MYLSIALRVRTVPFYELSDSDSTVDFISASFHQGAWRCSKLLEIIA